MGEAAAHAIARATLLAQFVCDNLSGTLVYPFFASATYRAGFSSRGLGLVTVISSICVFVVYRGLNLGPLSPKGPLVRASTA
jgi:hypothetical protein